MTPAYLHGFMSRMLGRPCDPPYPIYDCRYEEWEDGWKIANGIEP